MYGLCLPQQIYATRHNFKVKMGEEDAKQHVSLQILTLRNITNIFL